MISILFGSLWLTSQPQAAILEVTSPTVSGYCLASERTSGDSLDRVWFAIRVKGTTIRKLVRLPIERYDRNVPDVLFINGPRAIALVNGAVDFHKPFFLVRTEERWAVLPKPGSLEGCIGRSGLATFGEYQVYAVNCHLSKDDPNYSHLIVFGRAGLKVAKVPFQIGDVRRSSQHSIEFEVWTTVANAQIQRTWVRFKWPFAAKGGYWQLSKYGVD